MLNIGFELIDAEFMRGSLKNFQNLESILRKLKSGKVIIIRGELLPETYKKMIEYIMGEINEYFYGVDVQEIRRKKGFFLKEVYTIIKPKISGINILLNEKNYGLDISIIINKMF